MSNIQIIQGDFEKKLKLQFAPGIKAGFPSPADDYSHETLDFNRDLIRNPEATFYGEHRRRFRCAPRLHTDIYFFAEIFGSIIK